ncbi:MAG: MAPEG family protein [Devosia sp.]
MLFQVTAVYAALFAIFLLVLSNMVSAQRGRTHLSILHGEDMELAVWIRRHGNFVENVPMALILMGLCEARGMPVLWLNVMGVALLVARLAHVLGLSPTKPVTPFRMVGALGTQLVLLAGAVFLLWSAF